VANVHVDGVVGVNNLLPLKVAHGVGAAVAVLVGSDSNGAMLAGSVIGSPSHLVELAADLHQPLVLVPGGELPNSRVLAEDLVDEAGMVGAAGSSAREDKEKPVPVADHVDPIFSGAVFVSSEPFKAGREAGKVAAGAAPGSDVMVSDGGKVGVVGSKDRVDLGFKEGSIVLRG